MNTDAALAKLWAKVNKGPGKNDCWLWTGRLNNGYGVVYFDRKTRRAHRVTYVLACGPIPDGLSLDHLCRVTACVRPSHLQAVTVQENIRRGCYAMQCRADARAAAAARVAS